MRKVAAWVVLPVVWAVFFTVLTLVLVMDEEQEMKGMTEVSSPSMSGGDEPRRSWTALHDGVEESGAERGMVLEPSMIGVFKPAKCERARPSAGDSPGDGSRVVRWAGECSNEDDSARKAIMAELEAARAANTALR